MAPKGESSKIEARFDELYDEVFDLADAIKDTKELGLTIAEDPSRISLFKAHISRIDSTFDKFLKRIPEIKRIATALEREEPIEKFDKLRSDTRKHYFEALSLYPKENVEVSANNTSLNETGDGSAGSIQSLKLPVINIPIFNGDISTWVSYKDTFLSLVHENPQLSNVQKYHYLKSSLKGTAAQTIAQIPISAQNYAQAWSSVTKRYDNKRLQGTYYLTKTFSYETLNFTNNLKIDSFYYLSDSSTVLSWIRLPPHTLKTFVANRVTTILQQSSITNWYHVSSSDNSADIASRGLSPTLLLDNKLWWNGPEWLLDDHSNWPITEKITTQPIPELKSETVLLANPVPIPYIIKVSERYSSLTKLLRVHAYLLRFIHNASHSSTDRRTGPLTSTELNDSTMSIIKSVQSYYFELSSKSTTIRNNSLD